MDCVQTHLAMAKGFFDHQCDKVGNFLDHYPLLYKITLVALHIFSAVTMCTFMNAFPLAPVLTCTVVVIRALLYRSAVERFCVFRFTLPSLVGGMAMWAAPTIGPLPLLAYLLSVSYISHLDIEERMQKLATKSRCCSY